MSTTAIKYSPSINIIRDSGYDFNYIVTPNSGTIFNNLLIDISKGIKAHTIIGAYGTGKSSFLLASEQTLTGTKAHFKESLKGIKQLPKFEFINIVGEYCSIIQSIGQAFGVEIKNLSSKEVIKAIEKEYLLAKKKGQGLAIVIDEFGKFLEYASDHNPEAELFFVQQLSEFVNNSSTNLFLLTTLHQSFNSYATGLNKSQQQEWDKVNGRLKAIVFNEPIENLLFIAGERFKQLFSSDKKNIQFDKLFQCIKSSNAFPFKNHLDKELAKNLLPFDVLSASILTLALQEYGQNERSLFSFMESRDFLEIAENNNSYYSLPQVYNYLWNNFYTTLSTSKNNSQYNQWSAIRKALEKLEGVISEEQTLKEAGEIIKCIGLLNIFSSASGKLDFQFYVTYSKLALGLKNPEKAIKELEQFNIVRYTKHNLRYSISVGTDVNIDLAIDEAGRLVEMVTDVVYHLNQYFDFPFIPAKAISFTKGIPRFFQFKLSEEPISSTPQGEVDGFINLVFSDSPDAANAISEFSRNCIEPVFFGYYRNTKEIKSLLYEIEKVKSAIATHKTDKEAVKEFKAVEEHYKRLLNHYVLDSLYSEQSMVTWYYNGNIQNITSRQSFNQKLSMICEQSYPYAPVFKSELINKTNISSQIAASRKRLLERLQTSLQEKNIGFKDSEFPPEKSIYLTLLKQTGIHKTVDEVSLLTVPDDISFRHLWNAGEAFLNSTKSKERSITDLIEILSSKPFKLKKGFIDFWVPIFLIIKADEYALYENDIFIAELTGETFDLMNKKPGFFKIKAFDVAGVKLELFNRYRILLNQSENQKPNAKVFIQTIKPFLTFYRDLPEYSKTTNRLKKLTLSLRKSIATAKDPEKSFFEDFPAALGFSFEELQSNPETAKKYIKNLQDSIKELRTSFDGLVSRFEEYLIADIFGFKIVFSDYKSAIVNRYSKVKKHLLLPEQKVFYTSLHSQLDDRNAWLSSVAQSIIKKPLGSISDEEEIKLFEKLKELTYELDNLTEISKENYNSDEEEIIKFEITSFIQGMNSRLLRIPKAKTKEVEKQIQQIKNNLGKDKKINITVLTKLLQEVINND